MIVFCTLVTESLLFDIQKGAVFIFPQAQDFLQNICFASEIMVLARFFYDAVLLVQRS